MFKGIAFLTLLLSTITAHADDPPVIVDYFPEDGATNVDPDVVIWIHVTDDIGIDWDASSMSITADGELFDCDTEIVGDDLDFTWYFYAREFYEDAYFECVFDFYDIGENLASAEWSFTTGFLAVKETSVGWAKAAFAE